MTRFHACGLFAVLVLGAGACSKSVHVQAEFPTPLVEALPIDVGLYYDPGFREYAHEEAAEDRDKWVIATGKSQVALFDALARGVFRSTQPLAGIADADSAQVDLILAPSVDTLQFSMPRETSVNVFEVWIKYNVRVHTGDGELLVEWPLSAYGKTPTAFLRSKNEALNLAVRAALRDAGANFTRGFAQLPEVREWMASHRGG